MPHSKPTTEPDFIRAGDSIQWLRSLPDFPAPEWTLKYVLLSATDKIEIVSTADNGDHKVNVSSSVSKDYKPGNYTFTGYVEDSEGERHTLFRRMMEVKPDLVSLESKDGRSFAERTLAKVESAISQLADRTLTTASINGQNYTHQDIEKLYAMRARLKAEVELEKAAEGIGSGGLIYGTFERP